MSQATTATARKPAPGGGKRILGMKPMTAYLVFGGVLLAGIGIYLWKQHQAAAAAAAAPAADTNTNGDCTDSQGNTVPCPGDGDQDYSGELSAIQTELESVLAAQGATTTTGTTTTSTTGKGVVPNLMGLQSVAAQNEAAHYGFKVKFSGAGTVVSQTPGPGSEAVKGSVIDLGRQEISAAKAKQVRNQGAAMAKKAGG